MKKHYNIKITGKVQGVWFRKSTQDKARELGIKGFVRNEPDGSVYAEAEGEEDQLKKYVDWCHDGSPQANVSEVEVNEGDMKGFSEFEVRH